MAHTEWLPSVQLRHFVTTCTVRIVGAGGCPVVVAQWQSTGSISQGIQGSITGDCWPFYFPLFHLKTSNISVLITDTLYTHCFTMPQNWLARIIHSLLLFGRIPSIKNPQNRQSLDTEQLNWSVMCFSYCIYMQRSWNTFCLFCDMPQSAAHNPLQIPIVM